VLFKEKIFFKIKEKIEKEEKSFFLYFLSLFFKSFVFLKNFFYEKKIFKSKDADILTVSIGNIVCGGTGKTPFVIFLANRLNKRVAVISRGYGSKGEDKNIIVSKNCLAKDVGDEPLIIMQRINGVVIIGKDKFQSLKIAKDLKMNLAIIDDGFQHRRVKRDIDIVILNGSNPFSNGYFLPYGFLRDDPKRLKDADFILVNNCENFESFKKDIRRFSSSPIITFKYFLKGFRDLKRGEVMVKKRIAVFCAIANPISFLNLLKENGYEIIDKKFFIDHAFFKEKSLKDFSKKAQKMGAEYIVCTEKDMVKIKDFKLDLPICYAEIDLKIIFGKEHFEKLISSLDKKIYNKK